MSKLQAPCGPGPGDKYVFSVVLCGQAFAPKGLPFRRVERSLKSILTGVSTNPPRPGDGVL
jgi:hypothetical protein